MYSSIDKISTTRALHNAGNNVNQKKKTEQAREDKSLSRTIYGSRLRNDEVTRNSIERKGTSEEREGEGEREGGRDS